MFIFLSISLSSFSFLSFHFLSTLSSFLLCFRHITSFLSLSSQLISSIPLPLFYFSISTWLSFSHLLFPFNPLPLSNSLSSLSFSLFLSTPAPPSLHPLLLIGWEAKQLRLEVFQRSEDLSGTFGQLRFEAWVRHHHHLHARCPG